MYVTIFEVLLAVGTPNAATIVGPMTEGQCNEYVATLEANRPAPPGYKYLNVCVESRQRIDGELGVNGCELSSPPKVAVHGAMLYRYSCRAR
jgi:hypothetical protein